MPIVELANTRAGDFQINLFIPDLHSFTTPINYSQLQQQIVDTARTFVAAGLPVSDPEVHLYRQSYISAHSELTWILDCFTGVGEMNRMTQFKDKSSAQGVERTSVGLFHYPVLMAADILLYDAKYIPVGEDQTQHLEFTRDIAIRLNNQFGELFTIPEPPDKQLEFFGTERRLRIMDLADPTKKMSKSSDSDRGAILLTDEPAKAAKKIMSATTDNLANIQFDRERQPGISNLLEILSLLRGDSLEKTTAEFAGQSRYGDFKGVVADQVRLFLEDFQVNLARVDEDSLRASIARSEQVVARQAQATLLRAQQAVGLRA